MYQVGARLGQLTAGPSLILAATTDDRATAGVLLRQPTGFGLGI